MILLLAILLFWSRVAVAGELPPPPPRKDRPTADELYFRKIHQEWNNLVITTTNPNGTRYGRAGDQIIYSNAGYKHCINVSTTAGEGTAWVCAASAYSAP